LAFAGAAMAADAPKRKPPANTEGERVRAERAEKQERADIVALERSNAPRSIVQERKLQLAPNDVNERLKAAEAYLQEAGDAPSKLDDATEHVNAVLAADGKNVRANMVAGRIAMLRNQPQQAQVHYQAVLGTDPNNASAYLALGESWSRLGNDEQASLAYNEYRKLKGMTPLAAPGTEVERPLPPGQQAPIIVGPDKKEPASRRGRW
jgi:lipopolysaccharide biosynthesis regulator YciM